MSFRACVVNGLTACASDKRGVSPIISHFAILLISLHKGILRSDA